MRLNLLSKLIQEWETNTGQKWPRYMAINKKTGELEAKEYQAHHIIPQQHGGPHEWWNMHPLKGGEQHQSGVHGTGSVLNQIIKESKE